MYNNDFVRAQRLADRAAIEIDSDERAGIRLYNEGDRRIGHVDAAIDKRANHAARASLCAQKHSYNIPQRYAAFKARAAKIDRYSLDSETCSRLDGMVKAIDENYQIYMSDVKEFENSLLKGFLEMNSGGMLRRAATRNVTLSALRKLEGSFMDLSRTVRVTLILSLYELDEIAQQSRTYGYASAGSRW